MGFHGVLGAILLISASAGEPIPAPPTGDAHARVVAEETLAEGALTTRIAPVTAHHNYERAHEPWQPHSQVKLRKDFTPELQKSVADIPE